MTVLSDSLKRWQLIVRIQQTGHYLFCLLKSVLHLVLTCRARTVCRVKMGERFVWLFIILDHLSRQNGFSRLSRPTKAFLSFTNVCEQSCEPNVDWCVKV